MSQLSKMVVWVLAGALLGLTAAIALVAAGAASIWLVVVLPLVVIAETAMYRGIGRGVRGMARRVKGH